MQRARAILDGKLMSLLTSPRNVAVWETISFLVKALTCTKQDKASLWVTFGQCAARWYGLLAALADAMWLMTRPLGPDGSLVKDPIRSDDSGHLVSARLESSSLEYVQSYCANENLEQISAHNESTYTLTVV